MKIVAGVKGPKRETPTLAAVGNQSASLVLLSTLRVRLLLNGKRATVGEIAQTFGGD